MRKINYLEGVRGLAAFLVLVHHFLLAFYPSHYYGDIHTLHTQKAELLYYQLPLNFISNGNFMVAIFFILSGYVLSRNYFIENNFNYLISAANRRYLRLFIPVAVTIIISFLLLKCSMYFNAEASIYTKSNWLKGLWSFNPGYKHLFQELLYKTMFWGNNGYATTLWSISIELYGSFLVYGLLLFSHNLKRKWIILILLILVILSTFPKVYIAFILGILINYIPLILNKYKAIDMNKNWLAILFFIVGLLLGAFPSTGIVHNTFYSFLSYGFITKNYVLIHVMGGFLVILSVQLSTFLQQIFGNRLFIYLGEISFSLYLLHPLVLGSFSCFLFLKLNTVVDSYNLNVSIVLIATIALCMLVANYFVKIDNFSVKISKRFFQKRFLN